MEIVGGDGSKTLIEPGQTRDFGRGRGFNSDDKTVSRRHVLFSFRPATGNDETQVHFEITGRNPIWVHSSRNEKVKIFRTSDKGEMQSGDMFCVSVQNPVWFRLKRAELVGEKANAVQSDEKLGRDLAESLQSTSGFKGVEDLDIESIDITNIDPVKEFGFVVMGHEFDSYPKKMIKDMRTWNWFLEEPGDTSEDEGDKEKRRRKGGRRKRKKGEEVDDEDWTGESEEDKEVVTKPAKAPTRGYTTRSKDRGRTYKDTKKTKKSRRGDDERVEEGDEDEDDETLGGFIVDDEDLGEEEEIDDEDEEEEEEEFDDELDEDE